MTASKPTPVPVQKVKDQVKEAARRRLEAMPSLGSPAADANRKNDLETRLMNLDAITDLDTAGTEARAILDSVLGAGVGTSGEGCCSYAIAIDGTTTMTGDLPMTLAECTSISGVFTPGPCPPPPPSP